MMITKITVINYILIDCSHITTHCFMCYCSPVTTHVFVSLNKTPLSSNNAKMNDLLNTLERRFHNHELNRHSVWIAFHYHYVV